MLVFLLTPGRQYIFGGPQNQLLFLQSFVHICLSNKTLLILAGKQASAYCPSCSGLVSASVVAWMRCWLMSLLRLSAGSHKALCQQSGLLMCIATRCNSMSHPRKCLQCKSGGLNALSAVIQQMEAGQGLLCLASIIQAFHLNTTNAMHITTCKLTTHI